MKTKPITLLLVAAASAIIIYAIMEVRYQKLWTAYEQLGYEAAKNWLDTHK